MTDLPDASDRSRPWYGSEPAYLAHYRAGRRALKGVDYWKDLLHAYAHAIPTPEALKVLARLSPLVEVGAGGGYWARLLTDLGVDIIATDAEPPTSNSWTSKSPWTNVKIGDAVEVARFYPDRTLFSCWPDRPGGYMDDVIPAYAGSTIALITTPPMGPEYMDQLYVLLEEGWDLRQRLVLPSGLERPESLMVWRRKSASADSPGEQRTAGHHLSQAGDFRAQG